MTLSKGFRLNSAVTPLDYRLATQGLLMRSLGGAPRTGILHSGSASGNIVTPSSSALQVTLLDQVVLAVARASAGTDGVDVLTNVGALNLALNAPTANSWYATLWVRQNDSTGAGGAVDGDSLPRFDVTYGAAAASPAIPNAPTGATKIGHILIPSGATTATASGVVYTETIPHTALVGGRIRFRSTTEMNNEAANLPDGVEGFIRSGDLYFLKGGAWVALTGLTGFYSANANPQAMGNQSLSTIGTWNRNSESVDDGFASVSGGTVRLQPGRYVISVRGGFNGAVGGRGFLELQAGVNFRETIISADDSGSTSATVLVPAGSTMAVTVQMYHSNGSTMTANAAIRIMKVG